MPGTNQARSTVQSPLRSQIPASSQIPSPRLSRPARQGAEIGSHRPRGPSSSPRRVYSNRSIAILALTMISLPRSRQVTMTSMPRLPPSQRATTKSWPFPEPQRCSSQRSRNRPMLSPRREITLTTGCGHRRRLRLGLQGLDDHLQHLVPPAPCRPRRCADGLG